MIQWAIDELGGRATNAQIRKAILARYPEVNPDTINTQINICTVNSPSRIHLPENSKPRVATDPRYDFLFRIGRGEVERYDPARHGIWEIVKDADGRLRVVLSGDDADDVPDVEATSIDSDEVTESPPSLSFSLEQHLRDFLAANIGSLDIPGRPLSLHTDDAGRAGVEYRTEVGPIDILALDASGDFVVFELKLGLGPDAAVGQLARYMGWVRHALAGDRAVRGVIVARTVDEKLRYAASVIPNISLYEYAVSFTLQPVERLDPAWPIRTSPRGLPASAGTPRGIERSESRADQHNP